MNPNASIQSAKPSGLEILAFRLDEEWFAFPVVDVFEIIPEPKITWLPNLPAAILGIIYHRGSFVSVTDLSILFSSPSAQSEEHHKNKELLLIKFQGMVTAARIQRGDCD